MLACGIIPARLQSTRLPRKLLLDETGKPLLQYTWEAAGRSEELADVVVATDSLEIRDAVTRFGGRSELTGEHPSGTDRIAEVAARSCPWADIVVNIQGDEPEMDPEHIDKLVQLLKSNPNAQMATLATRIDNEQILHDSSCTKVVCSSDGRALYFSRAVIPHARDRDITELLAADSPWRLHLGIYAYKREFLLNLTQIPPTPLERLEKLEQLRALEIGGTIYVGDVDHRSVGIDTPDDYARFVERQRSRAA